MNVSANQYVKVAIDMGNFENLKSRLEIDGWFVGWALGSTRQAGWGLIPLVFPETHPLSGKPVDLDKVLFNHEQDCESLPENEEDEPEMPDGLSDEDEEKWWCEVYDSWLDNLQNHRRVASMDEMTASRFCFSDTEPGVRNLNDILTIIEECGCQWNWDKTGEQRIEISW